MGIEKRRDRRHPFRVQVSLSWARQDGRGETAAGTPPFG